MCTQGEQPYQRRKSTDEYTSYPACKLRGVEEGQLTGGRTVVIDRQRLEGQTEARLRSMFMGRVTSTDCSSKGWLGSAAVRSYMSLPEDQPEKPRSLSWQLRSRGHVHSVCQLKEKDDQAHCTLCHNPHAQLAYPATTRPRDISAGYACSQLGGSTP